MIKVSILPNCYDRTQKIYEKNKLLFKINELIMLFSVKYIKYDLKIKTSKHICNTISIKCKNMLKYAKKKIEYFYIK